MSDISMARAKELERDVEEFLARYPAQADRIMIGTMVPGVIDPYGRISWDEGINRYRAVRLVEGLSHVQ
jgi:hypothetical protein